LFSAAVMNCLAGSDILLGKVGAAVQIADWIEASDAPAAVKGALSSHNTQYTWPHAQWVGYLGHRCRSVCAGAHPVNAEKAFLSCTSYRMASCGKVPLCTDPFMLGLLFDPTPTSALHACLPTCQSVAHKPAPQPPRHPAFNIYTA
jgi:hypothetical protein